MHEHHPVKHWWNRHWRCTCGKYLDRCTDYWASLARSR